MTYRRLAFIALFVFAVSAWAETNTIAVPRMLHTLSAGQGALSLILPLREGNRRIAVEEFALWTPDARVLVHSDSGTIEQLPPRIKAYRGVVEGDPESMVVMTVDPSGRVRGLITSGDDRYQLTSEGAAPDEREPPDRSRRAHVADRLPSQSTWTCAVDGVHALRPPGRRVGETATHTVEREGLSGAQTYAARLEIETDYELWRSAGGDPANWAYSLTNAVAQIFSRDLHTTVGVHLIHVYSSSASCPWTVQPSQGILAAMYQLGDYYHQNYPSVARSAVVLLSGKAFGAGASWEASLCGGDFQCLNGNCGDPAADGHWGGTYAVCGSLTNGQVPNPDSPQNGIVNGLPSTDFWPLQEMSHELGHIFGGRHTNCIALSASDQTQFSTSRTYVDYCYSGEYGCYSGDVSTPAEQGTIMSACFNRFSGSSPNSRYAFGKTGEASYVELRDYMYRSGGTADGGANIISAAQNVTMSAISAPSTVALGSSNTASVTPYAGATYEWVITNGSITAGATSNQVTFTASGSGQATLHCSVYTSTGCAGVTDSVTIQVVNAPSAPSSVYATAQSASAVDVHWTAPSVPPGSAVYYNVYRSDDNVSYTAVGCTAATVLTDSSVAGTKAYLYKVRAAYGTPQSPCATPSGESGDSNRDLATPAGFMTSITAGTTIGSAHINALRSAVSAVYKLAYGANATMMLTDPTIVPCSANPQQCMVVKAVHITELRNYLNSARAQIGGIGTWTFITDPNLTSCNAATPSTCIAIKAAHFNEVRQAADRENH